MIQMIQLLQSIRWDYCSFFYQMPLFLNWYSYYQLNQENIYDNNPYLVQMSLLSLELLICGN